MQRIDGDRTTPEFYYCEAYSPKSASHHSRNNPHLTDIELTFGVRTRVQLRRSSVPPLQERSNTNPQSLQICGLTMRIARRCGK
jgi:hypothetical protein